MLSSLGIGAAGEVGTGTGGRWNPSLRIALLTMGFGAEIGAVLWFQAPHQTFVRFAAMDSGGELAIQAMIRQNLQPGIDFGYPYGLLALLLGRFWYGLFGLSPWAYQLYVAVVAVGSGWGLARFAEYRVIRWPGLLLIALAIPDLIFVTYLTSVQTIEQALLTHALAEQARGRRGMALAILTACCFVKPSLAFVQGLVVLIFVVGTGDRTKLFRWTRPLVLPVLTAFVLALILAVCFSPGALLQTVSPARGAAIYRANHYGFFFGQGRAFWVLPDAGVRDYFRYEVGYWLLGTGLLAWGAATGLGRLVQGRGTRESARDDELIVTCAVVHLTFVALLFGHRWTWVYSLPMLILGLALLGQRTPRYQLATLLLAGLVLISDRSKAVTTLNLWRTETASPATRGLWTSRQEGAEWAQVQSLIQGQHPAIFAMCEGSAVLFPEFQPPVAGYLVPGNLLPSEVERKARQLADASLIVSYGPPGPADFEPWAHLHAAFERMERIFDGQFFQIHRRVRTPESPR